MLRHSAWLLLLLLLLPLGACAHHWPPPAEPVVLAAPPPAHCPDARAARTVRVKVVTINLRHDADEWLRRFALVAEELVRIDPDVIGMQEVQLTRDQAGVLDSFLEKRGHAPYFAITEAKTGAANATGEGIGILSRWPIGAHSSAAIGDERVVIHARIDHPDGGSFDMWNTHLDQHRGGESARDAEARKIIDAMNHEDECRAAILTGDMNSQENGAAITRFREVGFEDSFRAVNGDQTNALGLTAMIKLENGEPDPHPHRRIDFILGRAAGSRVVKPISSEVVFKNHDAKGFHPSDHFGVTSTFDIGLSLMR